jgi:hypothetical protein
MAKVKYIKTEDNQIIVFGEYYTHDQFRRFRPISAGFIWFSTAEHGVPSCTCYGESISLGLKSDEEVDTELAKKQILDYGCF